MVQAVVVSLQTPGAPSQRPSEDTQPFIKEQHESAALLTVFWFILVINWRTLARQTHENSWDAGRNLQHSTWENCFFLALAILDVFRGGATVSAVAPPTPGNNRDHHCVNLSQFLVYH